MEVRPYEPDRDRRELWALKEAFELGLGGVADEAEKAEAYAGKLTEGYRERYLDWVGRCVGESPGCVAVAEADGLEGYAFLLPESLAMIWDAAVLNELYVAPERRGTGLADALLTAVLEVAADQDLPMDRVVLDVAPSNERARAFYRHHGFEPWGELVARPL